MNKNDSIRLHKCSSPSLSADQITHACLDATKSLEICNKICAFPDLYLRLTKAE